MDDDYEMFKIVIIGSMGTGKTNIATRYIRNQYNQTSKATVGVQFLSKIVTVGKQKIKVTLWDTAGQQQYKSLGKVYYKGANGVLIVYDVNDPKSYLDVESWLRLANENLNINEIVLMIVGNKVDIKTFESVPTQRPIKQYKDKFDIDCWEVSAKTGLNVKQVFAQMLNQIYQKSQQIEQGEYPDQFLRQSVNPRQSIDIFNNPSQVPPMQQSKSKNISENIESSKKINSDLSKKSTTSQVKLQSSNIKKKSQVLKSNRMTLANEQKKRAQESKEKKGCC